MNCLACKKVIDWRGPIIYLGGDRAIHVSEFLQHLEVDDFFQREVARLVQRDCKHQWVSMYQGSMRECSKCKKKELM